ncbi:MAG: hypothetical protein FWG02_09825 [Holophagaceae bacterium]|nr:hypothetical protein [Holophagaceae bacterium]
MKVTKFFGVIALAFFFTLTGCKGVRPILPAKKLPPDTLQMYFVKKISGPVDLTIDGTRIPVVQKQKKVQLLTISGLSLGKHYYFITSHVDAIGPDYGEFEIGSDEGVFQIHFSNRLKAALLETGHSVPVAEGIPGVKAILE